MSVVSGILAWRRNEMEGSGVSGLAICVILTVADDAYCEQENGSRGKDT